MRTTINIDNPILEELKRLGKSKKKTVSSLVNELLATSLKQHDMKQSSDSKPQLSWNSRPMEALVDIEDKDALFRALDRDK